MSSEAARVNRWMYESAARERRLTAKRMANKRPRISASTSGNQSQPVQQSPAVQRSRPGGRTSCRVEEDEGFIPIEAVESDSGSEMFESENGEEEFEAEDDGDGVGSEDNGEDAVPVEAQRHQHLQVAAYNRSQLLQSRVRVRRRNAVAAPSGKPSREIPVVLTDPDLLDCPICLDPLSASIYQCSNGHILCSTCCSKSRNKCPSCSLPIGSTRCLAMEKLFESLQINCKNVTFGCREILPINKKAEHEKTCPNTGCYCPYPSCTFASYADSLYLHFRCLHASSAISFRYNVTFNIPTKRTQRHIFLQERHEEVIFILNHDTQGDNSVFDLDCIGPSMIKSSFVYEIAVKSLDTCLSLKSVPEVCVKWERQVPKKEKCLTVPSGFLDANGRLALQVCIKKASDVV